MDAQKTGKIISIKRKSMNMTQGALAKKWERGLSFPDISLLIPLSEILNISLYDLLKGEDENG